jgi:hypothetical protein
MCVVHDLISDIETIVISARGNIDAISISFPFLIENSTQDLPLAFILSITGPMYNRSHAVASLMASCYIAFMWFWS